jgi:hypothetical protein
MIQDMFSWRRKAWSPKGCVLHSWLSMCTTFMTRKGKKVAFKESPSDYLWRSDVNVGQEDMKTEGEQEQDLNKNNMKK